MKVELDLSNYATKADLKNARLVDASFGKKVYLVNLKSNLGKLDNDKLKKCSNLSHLKTRVDKLDVDKFSTCQYCFKENELSSKKLCH